MRSSKLRTTPLSGTVRLVTRSSKEENLNEAEGRTEENAALHMQTCQDYMNTVKLNQSNENH